MRKIIKEYRYVLLVIGAYILLFYCFPDVKKKFSEVNYQNFMLSLLMFPPLFVLITLIEEWLSQDMMIKYLGKSSGIKGSLFAFCFGFLGMGAIYVAFPITIILSKKGVSFRNIIIFLGVWSSARLQQVVYELGSLGIKYTLIRFLLNSVGIFIISYLIDKGTPTKIKEVLLRQEL